MHIDVSTHSRTEAAAIDLGVLAEWLEVSTHSRTEAAAYLPLLLSLVKMFQHTAARRRLPKKWEMRDQVISVSTHSRTEAAAFDICNLLKYKEVSTHSRTEAAATFISPPSNCINVSTHSRTEAAATIARRSDL